MREQRHEKLSQCPEKLKGMIGQMEGMPLMMHSEAYLGMTVDLLGFDLNVDKHYWLKRGRIYTQFLNRFLFLV